MGLIEEGLEKNLIKFDPENHFPDAIAKKLKITRRFNEVFKFKASLCHRCNLKVPQMRYCHEIYGRRIKQYFGWYFKQDQFLLGVDFPRFLVEVTPKKIINLCSRFLDFNPGLMEDDV